MIDLHLLSKAPQRLALGTAVFLAGCGDGLLGGIGSSDDEGSSDTSTPAGDSSSGSSSSGGPSSASTVTPGESSTGEAGTASTSEGPAGSSTTGEASTGTPIFACENPDFQCSEPYACDGRNGSCGPLEPFDASGCLRPACGDHADCGEDELCYHGFEWGGCVSSALSCTEIDGACECLQTDDCGGAFCVQDEDFPLPHDASVRIAATQGRAQDGCGPVDQPTLEIAVTASTVACGDPLEEGIEMRLVVELGGGVGDRSLLFAGYDVDEDGEIDASETTEEGRVRVDVSAVATGSFEFALDGVLYFGTFDEIPYCERDILCG